MRGAIAAGQDTGHEKALPCLRLSNVTSSVFEIVLHYIYSDCIAALGPEFLSEEGAEQLFDAADRYLIFTMKVHIPSLMQNLPLSTLSKRTCSY